MTLESRLPKVGDLIDRGKYRIDALIGEGGMGVVFAATHMQMGSKRRALKWLQPALARDEHAVRRFLSEATIASRIDHPNVVSPIDVSLDENQPYIVMELLEGDTLADYLGDKSLPIEKAGRIFLPILQGVAAAHDQNIVHRDLKPGNIFLARWSGEGRIPKVLDFGIAKVMDGRATSGTLTNQGALLGTIQYMSPEQLQDASKVGPQTDVYALGVILYRMLTARMPYEGNLLDLALRIREGRPKPLASYVEGLPKGFDEAVLLALAPGLNQRYADVRTFANALAPFFPQIGLDFSPALRASREPTPISDLPPSGPGPMPPRPTPKVAQVESEPPRVATPVKDPSTFHPVATRPRSGGALRSPVLWGVIALTVVGTAIAVIAWPTDSYDRKPEAANDAHLVVPATAAQNPPRAPKASAAQPTAVAPEPVPAKPADAGEAAPAPGWNDLGAAQAPQAVEQAQPEPAAVPVVPEARPTPQPAAHRASAESERGPRTKRPREDSAPAQNAPPASPLDTILEDRTKKSLDTILETIAPARQ